MAEPCAAVLVPNFEFTQISATSSYAYLALITQANYDQEKQKIAASADIPIADLVVGGAASYEQFSQRRSQYFSQNQVSMTEAMAVSIVRQTVSDAARRDFVDCMRGASGLRVWFSDETDTGASIFIAFTGQPGAGPLTYKIQMLGGTPSDATEIHGVHTLPSGGSHVFLVARDHPKGEMRVSADGGGFAAEAISVVLPPPVIIIPPPHVVHSIGGGAVAQMTPVGQGTVANGGYWNALTPAPASVQFTWPNPVTIAQISLVVVQTPNGPTRHQIFGVHPDGTQVLLADLNGTTSDGQLLLQTMQPAAANLQSLRIDTVATPSWVAWRNIQIFGY